MCQWKVSKVVVENCGLVKGIGPFFLHVFACFHRVFTRLYALFFSMVHHFLHAFTESSSLEAAAAGRFNSLEWHIIGAQAWAKKCDMAPRQRFGWHGEVI